MCVYLFGTYRTGTVHEKMRNKTNSVPLALEEKMRKKKFHKRWKTISRTTKTQ
jgi:hypothetical protein